MHDLKTQTTRYGDLTCPKCGAIRSGSYVCPNCDDKMRIPVDESKTTNAGLSSTVEHPPCKREDSGSTPEASTKPQTTKHGSAALDEDAVKLEALGADAGLCLDDLDDEEWPKCPCCHGSGVANPLSPNIPEDCLVLSSTTCPLCEGSGDCP